MTLALTEDLDLLDPVSGGLQGIAAGDNAILAEFDGVEHILIAEVRDLHHLLAKGDLVDHKGTFGIRQRPACGAKHLNGTIRQSLSVGIVVCKAFHRGILRKCRSEEKT